MKRHILIKAQMAIIKDIKMYKLGEKKVETAL